MTETQREPVPRNDTDERDTALAFLAFQRHCLIKKTQGLTDEQLRRVLVPSGTNLLGLVQHVITGERWWFQHHVAGRLRDEEFDFSMDVPADRSSADVLRDFHEAVAESDAIVAATDLDALTALPVDGEPRTLRWVVAHKTSEIARHAGHADILRELIDGTTGR
ncbi:MAG: hypothetical protein JWO22_736 [Frankiales bacterium]|nr:hypothetical protein [Frankiales bacterium]